MKPRIHAMLMMMTLLWLFSPDWVPDIPSWAAATTDCRSCDVGSGTSCPADSETQPECDACTWCASCCFVVPARVRVVLIFFGQGVLLALSDEILLDGIHPSIWRPPTIGPVG